MAVSQVDPRQERRLIEDQTVQQLSSLAEIGKQARAPFEPEWYMNVAFFQGKQWLNYAGGRLNKPNIPRHRVTFTDNRIIGAVRTEIAKMTKTKPAWVAVPRTDDEEHIEAARMVEQMLDFEWESLRMSRKLRAALKWSRVTGAGFWKIYFDKTKGQKTKVMVGPDGQPATDPDSGRVVRADDPATKAILSQLPPEQAAAFKEQLIAEGECCIEVKSPWELIVDPLADDEGLESAEWIIEESVRSVSYLHQRYNVVLEPDADAISGLVESRMAGQTGSSAAYKGVRVFEYWRKPCSEEPEGRRVVWVKNRILEEGANPYGWLPYVMFGGIPVPGRFWPTSIVEQLRSIQSELNKTRSQIRENAARIGNPSLLESSQAKVEYTGVPGERIKYDPTMPDSVPQYLQPPTMPAYVLEEPSRLLEAIQDISGQHEVTQGKVPAGITAASAINLLLEQDDTRLGPDIADMELSLADAGHQLVTLIGKFYKTDRIVRLSGEDGVWNVFDFKAEVTEGVDHVEVQTGSAMPRSKAARQAQMQELLNLVIQYGLPLRERDLRRFFADFEFAGLERMFAALSATERQVNRENRLMALGNPLPINSYDDHEAHLEAHEEFQRSGRYWRAVQDNPQLEKIFEMHTLMHRQQMVAMYEAQYEDQQRQQQEAAQGAEEQGAADAQQQQQQGSQQHDQQVQLESLKGQVALGKAAIDGAVRSKQQNANSSNGGSNGR